MMSSEAKLGKLHRCLNFAASDSYISLRFLKYSCELQTDFNVKENAVFSQNHRVIARLVNYSPQLSPRTKTK